MANSPTHALAVARGQVTQTCDEYSIPAFYDPLWPWRECMVYYSITNIIHVGAPMHLLCYMYSICHTDPYTCTRTWALTNLDTGELSEVPSK